MGIDSVSIRETTDRDIPVIHRFIGELAAYEKLSSEVVVDEETLRETLFGGSPLAHAIIAEVGGEPAGFAVYFFNYSTFTGRPGLYIEDLYVREKMRGGGVGRALLSHCARVALDRGCRRLEFAVLHWNPARQFYERLGARPLEDWIVYRMSGSVLERAAGP
jgi:GNAT superfamily N-acetyltransferase